MLCSLRSKSLSGLASESMSCSSFLLCLEGMGMFSTSLTRLNWASKSELESSSSETSTRFRFLFFLDNPALFMVVSVGNKINLEGIVRVDHVTPRGL